MKLLKRITALMAALLIVVNIAVVNIFAVAAAPVAAGEIAGFLAGALAGSGQYSQSDIDGMSLDDMKTAFNEGVNNGTITIDTVVEHDPINNVNTTVFDYFTSNNRQLGLRAIADFVQNITSDDIKPTLTTDMNGYGVKVIIGPTYSGYEIWYGDFITLHNDRGYFEPQVHGNLYFEYYIFDSNTNSYVLSDTNSRHGEANLSGEFYNYINSGFYDVTGDVRYQEDSPALPEYAADTGYYLGEIDGTAITPDMLNPDGTVTIDGVTYDPADYLDPDNLSEEGKKQLINNIANVINNTYVISEDKPIVDEGDITVEVAGELESFTLPTGIITVFPFSLPWDFVRGIKLFSAKPVTPHFEVTVEVPAILNIPEQKWTLEIDLGKFETLAKITRWTSLFGFIYLLIFLTPKIVKGAGA